MVSKVIKVEANETRNDVILSLGIQGFRSTNHGGTGTKELANNTFSVNSINHREKLSNNKLPPALFMARRK